MDAQQPVSHPNHHAGEGGNFAGFVGALHGLTMTAQRRGDSDLAIELTGAGADDRVVDVGCGPGSAARRVARRGAQVIGVDPAPSMLRLGRLLGRLRGRSGISYLEGAAEALPLPDDSATVVWTIASAHHWPDIEGGLREARRVLRPGGRFLAVERQSSPGATGLASHGWTDAQVETFVSMCRDAGFVDVTTSRHTVGRPLHAVRASNPEPPPTP